MLSGFQDVCIQYLACGGYAFWMIYIAVILIFGIAAPYLLRLEPQPIERINDKYVKAAPDINPLGVKVDYNKSTKVIVLIIETSIFLSG